MTLQRGVFILNKVEGRAGIKQVWAIAAVAAAVIQLL
jgi:hypothetical protein